MHKRPHPCSPNLAPSSTRGRPAMRRAINTVATVIATTTLIVAGAPTTPAFAQNAPTCMGKPATIVGTDNDDHLVGTDRNDVIVALGGNDFIAGIGGVDTICAGPGDDFVSGGPGNDVIQGEAGDDVLNGQTGADEIDGGDGADKIRGDDQLDQTGFDDRLSGGDDNDIIYGGGGNDTIWGNDGNDFLVGEFGNDRLFGGAGNDSISGLNGRDRIGGGAGDDTLLGGDGNDRINGGDGFDNCQKSRNDKVKNCQRTYDFKYRKVAFNGVGVSSDPYVDVTPTFFKDALAWATVDGLNGLPVKARYLGPKKNFTWRLPKSWTFVEVEKAFKGRYVVYGYGGVVLPSRETGPFRLVLECCDHAPYSDTSYETRLSAATTPQ